MAPARQSAEDFVEVGLGPPCLWVGSVQPVDDENLQAWAPWVILLQGGPS